MTLAPLVGHRDLRAQFLDAIASNRLPQVILLTGPRGVGKQRMALWLAQRMVCSGPPGEPCGVCGGCRKVQNLAHPDVHMFIPVNRPKAGDQEKQVEEVAELLEGALAERRANPLWGAPDGMAIHGVATARLIQRRASLTASEGGARVFIIARAERLVPQESSQEAANALLKLLEEPPPGSLFILTTAEAGQMLATIRSRAVPVRMQRVSDDDVREFVAAHRGAASDDAVAAAHGSIGAALSTDESGAKGVGAARDFLRAVATGPAVAAERALKQAPWQARGDFTALLDGLAFVLANDARTAIAAGRTGGEADAKLAAVERVIAAREKAQGNVNPQLLLAVLADEIAGLDAA
jgi:DNA polymerase-3 subunit delta'